MPLPSSGQISASQIRTELQVTSVSPFSLDTAENGSYVPINITSPSKPASTNPAAMSEWYSYNHTYAVSCPATVTNLGGYSSTSPYADMWVVDLGTTSGSINVTINISYTPSAALWSSALTCEYGYPFNSSGSDVGGPGGTLFFTNLINSTYTTTASYNYNASFGSKVYVYTTNTQNTNEWPKFAITMSCPYTSSNCACDEYFVQNTSGLSNASWEYDECFGGGTGLGFLAPFEAGYYCMCIDSMRNESPSGVLEFIRQFNDC
jgi:hypothetical protein